MRIPFQAPTASLGLPSGPVGALLLGTLIVHGVQWDRPSLRRSPHCSGAVARMWIGNLMLLVLNLPLVGWWARLALVLYRVLYPTTVALALPASTALNHSTFDLWLTAMSGLAGYVLRTRGFEPAPLLPALVVSPPLRDNFNRARASR